MRSQTGDFTRAKGKEVMEGFIKAEGGGKDDLRGLRPQRRHDGRRDPGDEGSRPEAGQGHPDVSIDAVPDIFKAMVGRRGQRHRGADAEHGRSGASTRIMAFKAKGTVPPKFISTESKLYTPADDPQEIYDSKKGLGY